jgi:hypothetical protein
MAGMQLPILCVLSERIAALPWAHRPVLKGPMGPTAHDGEFDLSG